LEHSPLRRTLRRRRLRGASRPGAGGGSGRRSPGIKRFQKGLHKGIVGSAWKQSRCAPPPLLARVSWSLHLASSSWSALSAAVSRCFAAADTCQFACQLKVGGEREGVVHAGALVELALARVGGSGGAAGSTSRANASSAGCSLPSSSSARQRRTCDRQPCPQASSHHQSQPSQSTIQTAEPSNLPKGKCACTSSPRP